MASDSGDGDYLGAYRRFFEDFVAQVDPDDQLPVKVSTYDLTEAEISGEIIDWTLQYLNQKYCPPSLQSYLVHHVMEEVKLLCSKQPESCGWRCQENTFAPLRLMHAVTNKVNEVCLRYLDNSRLALLPPPPSTPIPLVSRCAIKNSRRKMEDRHVVIHDLHTMFSIQDDSPGHYYAVFDGHAGQDAAVYCAAHLHQYLAESIHYPTDPERALRDAFLTTDAHFIEKSNKQNLNSGTTAVCALLLNRKLYVAWVGDSQAVLAKRGQITQLVNPHKPDRDDERERVTEMGGAVLHWGIWRVNGQLAVSRAIGDVQYKPYVTGDPDIRCIPLDGTEDFLIVACDGLWDCVSEAMATTLVYQQLREDPRDLETVSQRLVHFARSQGSTDNISTIVVFLTNPRQIAARHSTSHPLLADVQLNNMESTNPFLSNTNNGLQFDVNPFGKQQQQQGTNGTCAENEENVHYRDHFEAPTNGKHANGAGFDNNGDNHGNKEDEDEDDDDDDDLGPETDVDAVDEGAEVPGVPPITENLSRELFPEKLDDRENLRELGEDHPPLKDQFAELPRTEEADQHALISDADNVADSEDSEDEWNYYPNKEKERITITGEGGERKDDKLTTSAKSDDEEEIHEQQTEAGLGTGDSHIGKEIEEPQLIKSEICAKKESLEEHTGAELEDDMDFQLNPNAAEFVPVSPPKILSTRANLKDDYLLSGSPQKQTPEMDDIAVPSQGEFQVEVSLRPHEMEQSNGQATKELPQTDFTDYLMDRQKSGNGTALGLDESEVSSTKAEFGDESTTSFMTATDFQKTGISLADDSFTGSDREDYDIAKDPMAMSFTPGDFQAAFEKEGDDLNVIHQLNESDLIGDEDGAGITYENFTAQSPELHPELTTLVTPDTDHPPPTAAFPDSKNENLLELVRDDLSTNENQSHPTSPEPFIKNETSLMSGLVELVPPSCLLGSRSAENDSKMLDQAPEETEYHALDTSSPLEGHVTPEQARHGFCTVSDKVESLLDQVDIDNNVSPILSLAPGTKAAIFPGLGAEAVTSEEVASLLGEEHPSSPLPDVANLKLESTIEKSSDIPDLASFTTLGDREPPLSLQPVNNAELQTESEFESHKKEFSVDADVKPANASIDSFLDTPPSLSKNQSSLGEGVNTSPDEQFKLVLDQTEVNDTPAGTEKQELLCEFESQVTEVGTQQESPRANKTLEESAPSKIVFDMARPPFSIGSFSRNDAAIDGNIEKEVSLQFSSQLSNEEYKASAQPEEMPQEVLVQTETVKPEEASLVSGKISSAEGELKTLETLVNEEPLIGTPVMSLSESMQEFTGLEEQLKPEPQSLLSNGVAEIADTKLESQIPAVENSVVDKIVSDVDVKPDTIGKTEKIEKVERTEPKTKELSVGAPLAAVAAGTVAAAATVGASGVAKTTKAKAGVKAPPRTATATRTTNKSTPTSPTKAASATQRTIGTSLAKKPTLGTASRPKQLETTKTTSVTSTTNKSPAGKTAAAPTKPTTLTKTTTARTSTLTSASRPKPTTTTSRLLTATSADKKPTTNGDAKPLSKTAAPKPAARPLAGSPSTATKTLTKTSTAARSAPGTTAAPLKSRPASAATTLKPKVAPTGTTSTSAHPRPKSSPAPGSTASAAPKPRSTLTKSLVTDKQTKETTNKQLSSTRTGGSTLAKSSGRTSTTGTTTMAKRSLASKNPTPAAAQPQKKPAPITRPGGKLSSLKDAAKTTITSTTTKTTEVEVVQNGVSEVHETKTVISSSTVEEDVPQKDVSPVTSSTHYDDNQLIMTAD